MKNLFFGEKLYTNASYLFFASIVTTGLGFFFWTIVARFYSEADVGIAATIISSITLLAMFSALGFEISLIRFLPHERNKRNEKDMVNSCLTISALVSIILSIIFLLGLNIWAPKLSFINENFFFAAFFIIFGLVWLLLELIFGVFIAKRAAKYVFLSDLIFSILKIPIPLIVIMLGAFGIFFSWGIAALVAFLLGPLYFLPKVLPGYKPRPMLKIKVIEHMFHFSFGNYIARLLSVLPGMLLPLMITSIVSPEITAYFYISWMISSILFMIPLSISNSLLAEASSNEKKLEGKLRNSIKFTSLFLIPGVIFLIFLGDKLLLLFGRTYMEHSILALKIFALSSIPLSFNIFYMTLKNIEKKVKTVVMVNFLIAFITLGLSYTFMGTGGGLEYIAFAWILSQIVVVFLILFHKFIITTK